MSFGSFAFDDKVRQSKHVLELKSNFGSKSWMTQNF